MAPRISNSCRSRADSLPAGGAAVAEPALQVSPDPLEVAGGAATPADFEVLVTGQEGGGLEVTLDTGEGGGTIGLDVVVDGDEWSLEGP